MVFTCPTRVIQFYSPFARDRIFWSLGKAFGQKWEEICYAHPHNETDLQQAIHRARIAAKNDPKTITILISKDINWYHNFNPYTGPFPDTQIITHTVDTIIYEEPTIPPELNTTRKELSTLRIFCIHHQNNHIGTYKQMNQLTDIANKLQILQVHTQIAPPTPVNTTVNPSKKMG